MTPHKGSGTIREAIQKFKPQELLSLLGYNNLREGYAHPDGRKAIFLGDLSDRGPRIVDTFRLVMKMVSAGNALCIPGNHDEKLERYLNGRNVQITQGLETTVGELKREDNSFKVELREFLSSLVSYYRLDDGKLVVAYAGIRQEYIGRASSGIREFCLYGETNGDKDDYGLPVRLDWANDYRGNALIVYGHTPTSEVTEKNHTYCIDNGCVFGGKLTAFRYPERELVSIDATQAVCRASEALKDFAKQGGKGRCLAPCRGCDRWHSKNIR